MPKGVLPKRMNKRARRGLTIIYTALRREQDNDFERLLPYEDAKDIVDVIEALGWMEQHVDEEEYE